jgi:2-methylcitrate dehydratase PrpD
MSTLDFTRQIARFALSSRPADVPASVRHEGTRALVNWIGLPVNACRHDTVERAVAAYREFSGRPQASLLGRGERMDIFHAALINCIAAGITDFDDTHLPTVIHPTAPVASALLALAERQPVSGRDFLHALLLGIEMQCRLANALAIAPARVDEGWFLSGLTGGVGAAIATGRLLGLDEQQMIWAIGLAAARASGPRETHGSMAKNMVMAWAGEEGMRAAFLAARGFSTSDAPIEGPRGLGRLYARDPNYPALVERLGEHWELTRNAYKPFPSGIVTHGATSAALEVAQASRPDPSAIGRIDLIVHPLCLKLTGRREPRTAVEATFSVYHWVALALIDRRIGIGQFTDACVARPEVVSLRDRAHAVADESYRRDEANIKITLGDGRVLEHHVEHALGSFERPMDDATLTAKLHDLVDSVIGAPSGTLLAERCWGIEDEADAACLVAAACGR